MSVTGRAALAALALITATVSAQVPSAARRAEEAAGITAPVVAWCQGQFRPGQHGFAIAAGGRYLVLDGSGMPAELATFTGKPDLSCYSRAQAHSLHRDIQRSDTLSGRVAPRYDTTTICAFVDATTARCWQYSPAERMYIEVGGWSTLGGRHVRSNGPDHGGDGDRRGAQRRRAGMESAGGQPAMPVE